MSDPRIIYLAPECQDAPDVGRVWCDSDRPIDCECIDGPHPWIPYLCIKPIPINTAPKDGTRILLCEVFTHISRWRFGSWGEYKTQINGIYSEEKFWRDDYFNKMHNPTHWLPQPPVPKMTGGNDGQSDIDD